MSYDEIINQALESVAEETVIVTSICLILGCLFAAFFSFRFFRIAIVVMGLLTGFSFGFTNLGMLVSDSIDVFNAPLILGVTCAVVFAILAPKFYKLCIHLLGGIIGYIIGYVLFGRLLGTLDSTSGLVAIGIGLATAFIGARLLYRFFKPYLIISSAYLGSMAATSLTAMLLFGENDIAAGAALILGILLSVIAMVAQFKMNSDRELDL